MVSNSHSIDPIVAGPVTAGISAAATTSAMAAASTTILHPQEPSPETVQTTSDDKSVFTMTSMSTSLGKDSNEIRSRLLNRLGIYGTASTDRQPGRMTHVQPMTAAQHRRVRILRGMGVGYTMMQSPPDGSVQRDILAGVVPFQEELKTHDYDDDEHSNPVTSGRASTTHISTNNNNNNKGILSPEGDASTAPSDTSDTVATNGLPPKTSRIAFQDVVDVMPIPTRHEYSDRIKSKIWSNRHELQENAERNAVEFASEGWKWENVIEDEGMYICSASGELVHPAWVGDVPRAASSAASETATNTSTTNQPAMAQGTPIKTA